ncbi:DprA-like winged helix domain-containing protein [Neisseria dentiae]|uniref:DprA-like winged helix domain-containing protein n=1 Tax=Neisseria dentiae TaxID=194197 RepID=UPI00359C70B9
MSAEQPAEHPLLTALGYSPAHPDSLAQALNLPAAEIYAQLLELELANQIAALPGGRYQRVK